MNLYTTHSKQFDQTRQAPWRGWGRVLKYFQNIKDLSVLDIGCGNGRFYKFLSDNKAGITNYLGLDNSKEMLEIFGKNFQSSNLNLQIVDVNSPKWMQNIPAKYNLIVAFGVLHHLETIESREYFYKNISNLLNPNGILILTFWQFEKIPNLMKEAKDLGERNYLLRFGENGDARFAHGYSETEVRNWKLELERKFDILEEFEEDGRTGDLNRYIVLMSL